MVAVTMHTCSEPGCPELLPRGQQRCATHPPALSPLQAQALYTSRRWLGFRRAYLASNPACVQCGAAATQVDHVRPIRDGGPVWDEGNLQALCGRHHTRKTNSERGGLSW